MDADGNIHEYKFNKETYKGHIDADNLLKQSVSLVP